MKIPLQSRKLNNVGSQEGEWKEKIKLNGGPYWEVGPGFRSILEDVLAVKVSTMYGINGLVVHVL